MRATTRILAGAIVVLLVCASSHRVVSVPKTHVQQAQVAKATRQPMTGTHIHVGVRDLGIAVEWMERVWETHPVVQLDHLAVFPFGSMSLILDAADHDSVATVGYESSNCDEDYKAAVERGAVSLEEPRDRPWGVRSAYLRGPGALKFEIEQPLTR